MEPSDAVAFMHAWRGHKKWHNAQYFEARDRIADVKQLNPDKPFYKIFCAALGAEPSDLLYFLEHSQLPSGLGCPFEDFDTAAKHSLSDIMMPSEQKLKDMPKPQADSKKAAKPKTPASSAGAMVQREGPDKVKPKPKPKKSSDNLPSAKKVGSFVRSRMLENFSSLGAVQEKSGMAVQTLLKLINDETKSVRPATLKKLCDAFNCAVGDIRNYDPKDEVVVTPETLGKFLCKERLSRGMGKGRMAGELKLASLTYQNLEDGGSRYRIDTLKKICNYFDVTPRDIMNSQKEEADRHAVQETVPSKKTAMGNRIA